MEFLRIDTDLLVAPIKFFQTNDPTEAQVLLRAMGVCLCGCAPIPGDTVCPACWGAALQARRGIAAAQLVLPLHHASEATVLYAVAGQCSHPIELELPTSAADGEIEIELDRAGGVDCATCQADPRARAAAAAAATVSPAARPYYTPLVHQKAAGR